LTQLKLAHRLNFSYNPEFLKEKQAERNEPKINKVKVFFRRNLKKSLVAGLFAVIFSGAALTSGVGFTATVNVTSSQIIMEGHPCFGYLCFGALNVTFNPVLYPVNHLFGSSVSTEFAMRSEPYDAAGESVKESIIMQVLLSEFPINIPFFYVFGLLLATALGKAIKSARKRALIPSVANQVT